MSRMRSRLPHALLLYGKSGIGKLDFALSFTQSLLCDSPAATGHACGVCASCGYFSQNNHPDYRLLTPEQETPGDDADAPVATASKTGRKSQISVAQVRELGGFLELTSHRSGGLKVVLVQPAEALNMAAANALLKVLEEPPPGVVFILVSHQPQRLLPTIMSRCQKIGMSIPATEEALAWLENMGLNDAVKWLDYAGGSPLAALREAEDGGLFLKGICQALSRGAKLDPFAAAPVCAAQGMDVAIRTLQKWAYDLLNCCLTGQVRYYHQHTGALQSLIRSVNLSALLEFQYRLNEARQSAAHPLNNELQLESILLQYTRLFLPVKS